MEKHPEGGYFKETYRASGKSVTPLGERTYSTAIYFLLPKGSVSSLHRLKSDEVWHFYLGGPMTLIQLFEDGELVKTTLGSNLKKGEKLQYMISAGCWFGGYPNHDSEYSFLGCTVAPGFEFSDFELARGDDILNKYPKHRAILKKLI